MSNLVPAPSAPLAEVSRLYVVFVALVASEVLQMESFTSATSVPGSKPFVRGIIQLRGRVVPVIDLRVRFGLPAAEHGLEARVIVGEKDGRAVALLADTAREVVRIFPSQERPPPQLAAAGGYVRAIVEEENRTLLVLDFAKVIGEDTIDV